MGETVDCIVKIRSLYPSMSIVEKKLPTIFCFTLMKLSL